MATRTIPPTRNTTGVTEVAFGGLSPIDAYSEDIDRPLGYFESTSKAITSITGIACLYVHATITAGMSHSIGATAGHFQTHAGGQAVGNIRGLASWVQLDSLFTAYAGGLDVSGVITPLSVGVRCGTGVVTLTTSMVVFGMHAQYLPGAGTVAPTYLFFARLNVGGTNAITALFYAENIVSSGWVAGTKATACGSIPLIQAHGTPTGATDEIVWVNVYRT